MNILVVVDHLGSGGAQNQIAMLARGLARRGHQVSCFIYYPQFDFHRAALEEAGIELHTCEKPSRFSLHVPRALGSLIRQGRFQIAVSFLTTPNVYNILATAGSGTKTIISERISLTLEKDTVRKRLMFQTYRLADRIVVNSEHLAKGIREAFPWVQRNLVVIRNGVDLERFKPQTLRTKSATGSLKLIAISSILPRKNYLGLIEALRVHRDQFGWTPSVRWVGHKRFADIDMHAFEQAEHLLDRYGLRSNWEWMGVRRDVPDLLRESDALVHPSFLEGLPNAICEAFSSGLPVLAGRVCDHPWLVGEGERGLLFDPSEPSDIANAIQHFASLDAHSVEEMGRRARQFAESELSFERMVTRYEELMQELVGA